MADPSLTDPAALGRAAARRFARPDLRVRRAPSGARVGTLAQSASRFGAVTGRSIVARRALGQATPGVDTRGLPVGLDRRLWGAVEAPERRRSEGLSGDPTIDRLRRLAGGARRARTAAAPPPRGLPRATRRGADSRAGRATGPAGAGHRLRPSVARVAPDPAVQAAGRPSSRGGGGSLPPAGLPPITRSPGSTPSAGGPTIRRLPAPAGEASGPRASASSSPAAPPPPAASPIAQALRSPATAAEEAAPPARAGSSGSAPTGPVTAAPGPRTGHPATRLLRTFGPAGAGAAARAGATGVRPPAWRTGGSHRSAASPQLPPAVSAGSPLTSALGAVRPAALVASATGATGATGEPRAAASTTPSSTSRRTPATVTAPAAPAPASTRAVVTASPAGTAPASHPGQGAARLPRAARALDPAPPRHGPVPAGRPTPRVSAGASLAAPAPPRGVPVAAAASPSAGATTAPRTSARPTVVRRRAERFAAAARARPADPVRPLPPAYGPLARAITGGRPVGVAHGPTSRQALAAAGTRAATVGSVIHLPRPPAARPAPTELATVAHELVHAAHPSPVPRLHGDDRPSPEERLAGQVERAVGTLARRHRGAPARGVRGRPAGTAGLPVGGVTGLAGALASAPSGAAGAALSGSGTSDRSSATATSSSPTSGGSSGSSVPPSATIRRLLQGDDGPAPAPPAPPAPAAPGSPGAGIGAAAVAAGAAPGLQTSPSPDLSAFEERVYEAVRRRLMADLERRGLTNPGVLW